MSWNNWTKLTKLNECSQSTQIATLWKNISPAFLSRIHHIMNIPVDTQEDLGVILGIIRKYFKEKQNEALERYKLIHIEQGEGEPFENFLLRLLDLSENTNLNRMTADDLISTLILCGIV